MKSSFIILSTRSGSTSRLVSRNRRQQIGCAALHGLKRSGRSVLRNGGAIRFFQRLLVVTEPWLLLRCAHPFRLFTFPIVSGKAQSLRIVTARTLSWESFNG